jgi:negative regulator of sigma E activity
MNEKLSSLFDNELESHEIDELLIQSNKQKKSNNWSYYQLIRDVIQKNYLGSNNLTKNIMDAIEKEPTQLGGFDIPTDNSSESKSKYWPIAASFAALFVIGLTALNLTEFKSVDSVVLVEADIPTELINDHHASASSNVNLFIQASYRK